VLDGFKYTLILVTDLAYGWQGDAGLVRLLLGGLPAQGLEPSVQHVVAQVDPGAGPHLAQFSALHLGIRVWMPEGLSQGRDSVVL